VTRLAAALLTIAAGALAVSCIDLDSFDTDPGECYSGKIVAADFVRQGFDEEVALSLTIDAGALADGRGDAGRVWTDDGLFDGAAVAQMSQLVNDSLSELQFPGGRIRNYLAHATATDGGPAMVVVSLMENERVEVRVMRPPVADVPEMTPLFGIFQLTRNDSCVPVGDR
jgi:hypothetical protein